MIDDNENFLWWINRQAFGAVNAFAQRTGWLHPVLAGYANYGVMLFAALLLGGWWLARRDGRAPLMAAAVWAPVGMLAALGLNQLLVASVHEARPYALLPGALVLVDRSPDPAFPSDHAVMAGAVAAGLWLVSRRLGIAAAVAALLMAFTRVYVGAHWPGDVAVGLAFGAAVVVIGHLLSRWPLTWVVSTLTGTRLRPLPTATPL